MAEDLGNLAVQIGMDASGFQTGMTQINRNLRTLNSEFKMNTAAVGLNGTALDKLRIKSRTLVNTMAQQQMKVNSLEAAYNRSVEATGRDSAATQNLERRLNLARASLSNMGNELQRTNSQIEIQSSRWTRMGNALTSVGERMKKVGTTLKNVGSKLSMSITAPIVAAGVAAAKLGIDFETSMAKVSTIADKTDVPIAALRKSILKLSDDTGIASTEIANNVYDAISAGQSTGDAVNFVTNSTKLAKAGFAEAGQSLDLLTTILNSYGMKSSEVSKVSDILVQVQNKGKVTVAELSTTMGKIIPTANQYGVSLEQVGAGYAIMTAKGIKSAEATTYMTSALNEMGKSGTVASKSIKAATGKTFPELIKSGKSVGDVLNIMNNYAKKNGKSLTDMFGSAEAGKAALILSGKQGKEFNTMLGTMKKSAGETDKAFAKVSDTTGMKFEKALNSLKNSGIKLGDSLTPIIEKIAGAIQKLSDKFNSLTPAQQENVVKFALIAAAIGPVILVVGHLVTIGGALATAFGTISVAVGAAGGAIAVLTGPIGIAIAAIVAIVAAGVLLYKNWDKIKATASRLSSSVKTHFNNIKNSITKSINSAKDGVKNAINAIKGFFTHLRLPAIRIPHIKLPHFSLSGSFSLVPPRVPSLGVRWYDNGGVFNTPSVIGVGEKRPEFVGALDDLRKIVREESGAGNTTNYNAPLVQVDNMTVSDKNDARAVSSELYNLQQNADRSRGK